jgi:hypothetical protein
MGRVFIDMLEEYKRGAGAAILERMNGLGLSPVS